MCGYADVAYADVERVVYFVFDPQAASISNSAFSILGVIAKFSFSKFFNVVLLLSVFRSPSYRCKFV